MSVRLNWEPPRTLNLECNEHLCRAMEAPFNGSSVSWVNVMVSPQMSLPDTSFKNWPLLSGEGSHPSSWGGWDNFEFCWLLGLLFVFAVFSVPHTCILLYNLFTLNKNYVAIALSAYYAYRVKGFSPYHIHFLWQKKGGKIFFHLSPHTYSTRWAQLQIIMSMCLRDVCTC